MKQKVVRKILNVKHANSDSVVWTGHLLNVICQTCKKNMPTLLQPQELEAFGPKCILIFLNNFSL